MDKKYINNVLIYILSGVLSLLGIGYIAYHMSGGSTTNVSTESAMMTTVQEKISAEAILLRDEICLEGAGDDFCGILRNGENAMAGQDVLWMFSGNGEIGKQIRAIEKEIRILQDSLEGDDIPSGLNTNQKDLNELYDQLLACLDSGDLTGVEQITVELQTCINRKKNSEKTRQALETAIAELAACRQALLDANSDGVKTLQAPQSGLFYDYTDGFESVCTVQAASDLRCADFALLKEKIESGKRANGGICKIAVDSYWYICLTVDTRVARTLKPGSSYQICFDENDSLVLDMKLFRMDSQYGEQKTLLVFGSRTVPQEFSFERIQTVTLTVGDYEGFRVPAGAVRYVDGKAGVYVTDGNKVRFRRVDILYAWEGNYIVKRYDTSSEEYADMLRLYDKIILSGKELYDGKYLD